MEGFIYPNEVEIAWHVPIVVYTFITGLVAGSFVISSLYHVFGVALRPVARFCLVCSLSFLTVAALPLLFHAGHPERAGFNMFFTPHLTSAMAGFGFIWFGYLILVVVEVLLVFRADIAATARSSTGLRRMLYLALALGDDDPSEESLASTERIVPILAFIGIPGAILLHGYVGFIFGSVKANPWWSTPLMPIIFLLSAVVSGIALVIVLYAAVTYIRRRFVDHGTIAHLSRWLLGFLAVDFTLEALEILSLGYEGEESWAILSDLITRVIAVPYLGIQFGLGTVVPLVIMGVMAARGIKGNLSSTLAVLSGCLVLTGVLAMRWNVIVGGQLVSKSLRGFTEYVPGLLGLEGLLVSGALLALPFGIFVVLLKVLPPWLSEAPPEEAAFAWPGAEEERRDFSW